MRGFYTLKRHRVLGATLHLHWSVALAAVVLLVIFRSHPDRVPLAICCYLGVMLLHEFGHALFARRIGVPYVSTFIVFFGHFSLVTAVFNLTPIRGLDGAVAWRIVPILWRESRQKAEAKKMAKEVMRRFK